MARNGYYPGARVTTPASALAPEPAPTPAQAAPAGVTRQAGPEQEQEREHSLAKRGIRDVYSSKKLKRRAKRVARSRMSWLFLAKFN